MTLDDLRKYCDDSDSGRYQLTEPWSDDKYTYASNGHILVRVPKIEDPSIKSQSVKISGTHLGEFLDKAPAKWFPVLSSKPGYRVCDACNGKGRFKYRGEVVPCDECDGEGKYLHHESVEVGGIPFSNVYLSWIAELPNSSIGPFKATDPAKFKFDGGDGLLMPRKS